MAYKTIGRGEVPDINTSLARKFGLVVGSWASFEKISADSETAVAVGSKLHGILAGDVKVGSPIEFKNSSGMISNVKSFKEQNGELLITTETSLYRLVKAALKDQENEPVEAKDVDSVVTAYGSVYTYLPDGRTQRFKAVEGKTYDPQEALVYVPNFEWIKPRASQRLLDIFGDNEAQFEQTLLDYVYGEHKQCFIVDRNGKKIATNQEIQELEQQGQPVFMTFGAEEEVDFAIPVSSRPRLGFSTYDTTKFRDEESGEYMRQAHLGNSVVRIIKKDGTSLG